LNSAHNLRSVETEVYSTYTTVCPVTETKTVGGEVVTVTYTTTSVVADHEKTTIEAYTTLPPVTEAVTTEVDITSSSLCPVTETKTISGEEVTIVYTSTSLIVVKVPTTIFAYTTTSATEYETTEVFTTESAFETFYTTVSVGSTIVITESITSTILVTSAYTITKTAEPPTTKATVFVPITLATSVPTYVEVTVPSEKTATTNGGTVYSTVPVPETSTFTSPPVTYTPPPVVLNTTAIVTPTTAPPPPSSSTTAAPSQITNAAVTNAPMAFVVAGIMAIFALA
jgi:hypothetical protein